MHGVMGLVVLVLDIIAGVDILKSAMAPSKKLLWILLVLFLPVLGMILYFLLIRKKDNGS